MEGVKITFFKDKKITKNCPAALLEFSTGETKVVTHRYVSEFGYHLNKAILDVIKSKNENKIFEDLSKN